MKPVALLIPGMLNDARVWAEVATGLADAAEVRIADVRTQDGIGAMADDATALLSDLPDGHPVVPVGFSMGGYVALELLARHPERWRSAVLLATSCLPETPEGAAARDQAIAAFQTDFDATCRAIARRGLATPDPALQERLLQMMRAAAAETAVRQTRAIRERRDHRAALASLRLPVHVMCGERDRIVPPSASQTLADTVPGARLHRLPDTGHMLPLERAQAVVDVVRQALGHGP